MKRTRFVFFLILAAYLGLITAMLAIKIASVRFLGGLFIASTIFSIGVVLLDFLGILGGHHQGDTMGDVTAGHVPSGDLTSSGGIGGDHAGDFSGAHGHAGQADNHEVTASDHGHASEAHGAQHLGSASPILSALAYLRLFVYFCLGFGPTGWAALASGRSALPSLALAAPVGIIVVFLAQAFFRFQRRDTDSQVRGADLVGQHATVLIPLDDKMMGRVRITVGPVVAEQYALAAQPGAAFAKGVDVVVASVSDECVYVR